MLNNNWFTVRSNTELKFHITTDTFMKSMYSMNVYFKRLHTNSDLMHIKVRPVNKTQINEAL